MSVSNIEIMVSHVLNFSMPGLYSVIANSESLFYSIRSRRSSFISDLLNPLTGLGSLTPGAFSALKQLRSMQTAVPSERFSGLSRSDIFIFVSLMSLS